MDELDLIIKAKPVETIMEKYLDETGYLYGYVRCCKDCRTAYEYTNWQCEEDKKRPIGKIMSFYDLSYGGIAVFTDNMEFATREEYVKYKQLLKQRKVILTNEPKRDIIIK